MTVRSCYNGQVRPDVKQQLSTTLWMVMTWFAFVGGEAIFMYVIGSPDHYDPVFRHKYVGEHAVVLIHGMAGVVALVFGPLQFWTALRQRAAMLHRAIGFIYLFAVAVAALTGLPMSLRAFGGLFGRLGFCTISVAWLVSAGLALSSARRHDFAAHRAWMLRNYALTFGAVQLRVYLFAFQSAGIPFTTIYPYASWLAWLPNLLLAEGLIRSSRSYSKGERS